MTKINKDLVNKLYEEYDALMTIDEIVAFFKGYNVYHIYGYMNSIDSIEVVCIVDDNDNVVCQFNYFETRYAYRYDDYDGDDITLFVFDGIETKKFSEFLSSIIDVRFLFKKLN